MELGVIAGCWMKMIDKKKRTQNLEQVDEDAIWGETIEMECAALREEKGMV